MPKMPALNGNWMSTPAVAGTAALTERMKARGVQCGSKPNYHYKVFRRVDQLAMPRKRHGDFAGSWEPLSSLPLNKKVRGPACGRPAQPSVSHPLRT